MNEPSAKIRTRIEAEDYHRFLPDQVYRISLLPTLLWHLIVASVAVALIYSLGNRGLGTGWLGVFFLGLLAAAGLKRLEVELQFRVAVKQDSFRQMNIWQTLTFEEIGIRVAWEGKQDTCIPYDKVIRVVETKAYFYFYLTPKVAAILRKRDCSEQDLQNIKVILDNKMGIYLVKI